MLLKIGELARRAGLTVRTLHHYDHIGLLVPSGRTDSGYRLYNRDDISRLYRIRALGRLGFGLAEIGAMLAKVDPSVPTLIHSHIASLDAQIAQATALRNQLTGLLARFEAGQEPTSVEWLNTLEFLTMYDKYLTREQAETLRQRKQALGEPYQTTGQALTEQIRHLMACGVSAQTEEAQALAQRWANHVQTLVQGDEDLLIRLDAMHRNEPTLQAQSGLDTAMMNYLGEALAEASLPLYARFFDEAEMSRLGGSFRRHAAQWPILVGELRFAMAVGLTPDQGEARALAARWMALSQATFGTDDPVMAEKFALAVRQEPALLHNTGIDRKMIDFVVAARP